MYNEGLRNEANKVSIYKYYAYHAEYLAYHAKLTARLDKAAELYGMEISQNKSKILAMNVKTTQPDIYTSDKANSKQFNHLSISAQR